MHTIAEHTAQPTTFVNGNLNELFEVCKREKERRRDLILPASALHMRPDGTFDIKNDPISSALQDELSELGIAAMGTDTPAIYSATPVAHQQVVSRVPYMHKPYYDHCLRTDDGSRRLLASNVNFWFDHGSEDRNFLVRLLDPVEGEVRGVIRAVLSDRYFIIPNYEAVLATLKTLREIEQRLGVQIQPQRANLSEKAMYLHFQTPAISIDGEDLLANYRHPVSGNRDPRLMAGFALRNSDVGHGAWEIIPRPFAPVCLNCFTLKSDRMRRVHLGSQLERGVIKWSAKTMSKQIELITSQLEDAVETFMSEDYLRSILAKTQDAASRQLERPKEVFTAMTEFLGLTEDDESDLLAHFTKSGDSSQLGAVQSMTYHAQTLDDADAAHELEMQFEEVLTRVPKWDARAVSMATVASN